MPGKVDSRGTPIQRLLKKLKPGDNGCIEWTGSNNGTTGHGHFYAHGKKTYVHRFSYQTYIGPIPDGPKWIIDA